jgi:hypothetical protein
MCARACRAAREASLSPSAKDTQLQHRVSAREREREGEREG